MEEVITQLGQLNLESESAMEIAEKLIMFKYIETGVWALVRILIVLVMIYGIYKAVKINF